MSFLYPSFLFALAALAIPIIIHLFNFRRYKRIQFSNVRFLQDVKEETRSRSKLKHFLTLLMRLLALAFIILAFAQPYLPSEESEAIKGDRAISIYIDNSFSMEGEEAEGRLIDLAKEQAIRIVENYDATDRFQLHTNSPSSAHHRWYSKNGIIERIEEVGTSPHTEKASSILAEQRESLRDRKEGGRIFFISDLQRSVTDPEAFKKDASPTAYFIPLQPEEKRNLYVDSVWFRTPVRMLEQEEELGVRLVNSGDERAEDIPVKLDVDGERTAIGSFDIPANGYKDTTLFYTHSDTGIHHATVSLEDHPVTFDDRLFFSYGIEGSIPVLRIGPSQENGLQGTERDPIASVFEDDPLFRYREQSLDRIDHSRLDEAQLIILDRLPRISSGLIQELQKFMKGGGHVAVIPARGASPDAYDPYLKATGTETVERVDSTSVSLHGIDTEHHFFRNVFKEVPENMDLPEVDFYYRFKDRVRSKKEPLLSLRNGEAFFFTYPYEAGMGYFFASPPDPRSSGLIGHAIYPTIFLRMAELSRSSPESYRTLGSDEAIELRTTKGGGESPFRLKAVGGDLELIPDQERYGGITRIRTRGRIERAGHYEIHYEGKALRGIGINYSRKESDLEHYDREGFQSELDALGEGYSLVDRKIRSESASMGTVGEGTSLWWYCIIFALAFLGLETLILAFPRTQGLER
jgi:hypothetical protein